MIKLLMEFFREKKQEGPTAHELFKLWFTGKKKLSEYTDEQLIEAERYSIRFPTADFHYWQAITTEAMRRRGEL